MIPIKSPNDTADIADGEAMAREDHEQETTRKARRPGKHDAYYLAPDSCEALPGDFWVGALEADLGELSVLLRHAAQPSTEEARYDADQFLTPRIFALSDDERAILTWVGEAVAPAGRALDELDGGHT